MSDLWDDTPETEPPDRAAAPPEGEQPPGGRRRIDGKDRHLYRLFRARFREQCAAENAPCHICNGPVDYSLEYPHPFSFSLDHDLPVSARPDLALDPANARASHLRHNLLRGASGGLAGLDENDDLGSPSEDWEAL